MKSKISEYETYLRNRMKKLKSKHITRMNRKIRTVNDSTGEDEISEHDEGKNSHWCGLLNVRKLELQIGWTKHNKRNTHNSLKHVHPQIL